MIQSTKWYGLKAKDPKSYFDNNCHSYQDISDLITNKGSGIIKDIAPCIESFIHQSEDIISDDLVDNLIISDNYNSICVANEAISYTIDNIGKLKPCAENSSWFIWSDIPHIERAYRMGKINESAIEILNTALESCADRVASNFTTFDTDRIKPVVEEFINNVTWDDMIHWKDRRDSIMESSSISGYIGDLITEISPSNWRDLALEGKTSTFDVCLEDIASNLKYKNPKVTGSLEGYNALAFDIYAEMTEANEDTFETVAENLYYSRQMTISVESFMDSIRRMIDYGMLPALETISYEKMNELANYLRDEPAVEGSNPNIKNREYNMELWAPKKGSNILYITGFSGSGKTTYAKSVAMKWPNSVIVNSDKFIMYQDSTSKYGDTSAGNKLLDKFLKENPNLPEYVDNNEVSEAKRVNIFMDWIQKEAAKNPKNMYIVEGVWMLYNVEPTFFKNKPLVIMGTSIQKSFKQRAYRDGCSYKRWRNKYNYKSHENHRKGLIQVMDDSVTESALLFNTYITDTYGKIPYIDNIDDYFNRLTVAMESSDDKEDKVTDKHKVSRAIKDSARKGEIAVTRAYNKYKLHEEDADEKMSHVIRMCKDVVFGSHENARREIIEGKGTSVVTILKTVLGGALIFNTSKVAFLLILITRWCNSGKIKRVERQKIIAELEGEVEILTEKINYAKYRSDTEQEREALYALMRTRNDVKNAIKRIKLKDKAERTHAGVGLPRGVLRR